MTGPGGLLQSSVYWRQAGQVERAMTLDAMMTVIRTMPVEERKRLIGLIVDTLTEPNGDSASGLHSILEFEGAAAEIWSGVDAQEYINKLRDEWDRHP